MLRRFAYGSWTCLGLAALLTACAGAGDESAENEADVLAAEAAATAADPGYAVGTARIELDVRQGRRVPVQIWYPAVEAARAEASAGHPAYEFEPVGAAREKIKRILAGGVSSCTTSTMHAAIGATPLASADKLPLLVVSHHFSGTRFSTFTINEELARRGFVVAAPDHLGTTLPEMANANLLVQATALTPQHVKQRVADLTRLVDTFLDPASPVVPEGLRGRIDPARIGSFGHSIGAITVGIYSTQDTRIKASAYLAMVVTSPLTQLLMDTPAINRFRTPGLYLLAQEDKSAAALGGAAGIRGNYERQRPPAWLVEVKNLGHFTFADDVAATPAVADGCGQGTRVDRPSEKFTNIPAEQAREIATRYTTAFFASQFQGASPAPLGVANPADVVLTKSHR